MEFILVTGFILIASILFWIMHPWKSKSGTYTSSSEEESSDNEPEITDSDKNLDTDAINPDTKVTGQRCSVNLKISDVRNIQDSLDDYEKISLIFLLSDNAQDCLKKVEVSEWAEHEMIRNSIWEEKFWEALAIIKNFQIPKRYGFSKEHLIKEYFPFQYFTSKYVPKFRKILYFICENLNEANEKLFIEQLKRDFMRRNLTLIEFPQMEMYFSFLLRTAYISAENMQNCTRIAKTLHIEDIYDLFKFIEEDNAKSRNDNKMNKPILSEQCSRTSTATFYSGDKTINSADENKKRKPELKQQYSNSLTNISADDDMNNDKHYLSSANSDSTQDNIPQRKFSEENYHMDGQKICLIIDQENFYTEIDPKYKYLLPETIKEEQLHTRDGTKEDSKRLKYVFELRNFKVKVLKNLSHLNLIKDLERYIANIDKRTCSCFFVVILSHGNKDVVYGANSCYVEISHIINIMDNKKYSKIPKGLILQACQGQNLLKHVDENLATDGASSPVEPSDLKSPNFFLFSSTVPGYASIRDKTVGTWFIQSFCDQIEKYADKEHFIEICTRVTEDVGNNKWRRLDSSYQMIPYLRTTLFKKLYI